MADDRDQRTEAPTAQRLEEADERGQVPFSQELTEAVLLIAGFTLLFVAGAPLVAVMQGALRASLGAPPRAELNVSNAAAFVGGFALRLVPALLPLLLGIVGAGCAIGFLQAGFRLRPKTLEWSLARIDPANGFRRVFSLRSAVRLAAALVKLTILVAVVYAASPDVLERAAALGSAPLREAVTTSVGLAFHLAMRAVIAMLLVGGADYAWQRFLHVRDLRMTKEEVRDELRQTQGDPAVKARIRRAQRAAAQRRMLRDGPKASAVVTNPTHFAVAIRYNRPGGLETPDDAPVVVAKGADLMAQRIRQIATEHGVPIVENPPLARTLFRTVEIGDFVPAELYRAVAEVLAFVYRLRGVTVRA